MQDERRSVKALERAHFFVPIGAAVASIIAAALGTLSLFTSLSFKTLTPTWYAIVGGAIAFVVTFTFAAIRERNFSKPLFRITEHVTTAFLAALDASALNPNHRLGGRHE